MSQEGWAGSGGETRTLNLVVNSHPLCRLSYPGNFGQRYHGRRPAQAGRRAGPKDQEARSRTTTTRTRRSALGSELFEALAAQQLARLHHPGTWWRARATELVDVVARGAHSSGTGAIFSPKTEGRALLVVTFTSSPSTPAWEAPAAAASRPSTDLTSCPPANRAGYGRLWERPVKNGRQKRPSKAHERGRYL